MCHPRNGDVNSNKRHIADIINFILSFHAIGMWIQTQYETKFAHLAPSFPAMGMWIQTYGDIIEYIPVVIPRKGNVNSNKLKFGR